MKSIYKYLPVVLFFCFFQEANAVINKCVERGKTVYTTEACQNNTAQPLNLKSLSASRGSDEKGVNFKIKDGNNWYKTTSRSGTELTKFPDTYENINPTLIVAAYGGPFTTPESYFRAVTSNVKSRDKEARISADVSEEQVAGNKAFYKKMNATYEQGGKSYPVVGEFWAIPRGSNALVIVFSTSKDDKSGNRDEVLKIINSLEFTN